MVEEEEERSFCAKDGLGKADGVPSRGWLAELGTRLPGLNSPRGVVQGTEKRSAEQERTRTGMDLPEAARATASRKGGSSLGYGILTRRLWE